MSGEISILGLFMQASLLVKLVMLTLLAMSIFSWAAIIQRSRALKQATEQEAEFEGTFWSGVDLAKLYQDLKIRKDDLFGTEQVFYSGFTEFIRLRRMPGASPEYIMDGVERAMRVNVAREAESLETQLPFLATVGSISPYIGLFGTVWGIMTAFVALGQVKQATLAMVAPGIAEALIATAMGLFAAIPAVIAFNRLTNQVAKLEHNYAAFAEDFHNILHRQVMTEHKES